MARKSVFRLPSEEALNRALERDRKPDPTHRSDRLRPQTGRLAPISSLAMNELLAEAEAAFDGIYLPYPRHTQMQLAIDRVRLHGLKARGRPLRGLRILGPTGSGKTTGIEEYHAHLLRTGRYAERQMPLLYIRLRTKTTVNQVLRSILQKFGDRYAMRRRSDELHEQVRNCIRRGAVELVVLDECQHLKNLSNDSLQVTDQFKVFLDDSIAPVVFVGTYEAQAMFRANPELCSRLSEPVDLSPLRPNDPGDVAMFQGFLRRLDGAMVERDLVGQSSNLDEAVQLKGLFEASNGIIGTAYRIVRAAMLLSISREAELVEVADLSAAVERWAIPHGFCKTNPFLRHAD
jgi:Bacterial TniB protein